MSKCVDLAGVCESVPERMPRHNNANRDRACRLAAVLVCLIATHNAFAIPAPTAPATSVNGTYSVAYTPPGSDFQCAQTFLQEAVDQSQTFVNVPDPNWDGQVDFSGKPDGIYRYRVQAWCEDLFGTSFWIEVSDSILVQVGGTVDPEPIEDQLAYEYESRVGDINSDGRPDLYIRRTSGGPFGSGTIDEAVFTQLPNGSYSITPVTSSNRPATTTWQQIALNIYSKDLNFDGFADIAIQGEYPGVADLSQGLFAFASGQPFQDAPQQVLSIESFDQFATDLYKWTTHLASTGQPSYFIQNADIIELPGDVVWILECDTADNILDCYWRLIYEPGGFILDYSKFSTRAIDFAVAANAPLQSKSLDPNSTEEQDMEFVLQQVFGVTFDLADSVNQVDAGFSGYITTLGLIQDIYLISQYFKNRFDDGTGVMTDDILDQVVLQSYEVSHQQLIRNYFNTAWGTNSAEEIQQAKQEIIDYNTGILEFAQESFENGSITETEYFLIDELVRESLENVVLLAESRLEVTLSQFDTASIVVPGLKAGRAANVYRMRWVRAAGRLGEDIVQLANSIGKKRAFTINGRRRIPDGINDELRTLSEIKNVQSLSFTQQLRDYLDHARNIGYQFKLYVRPNTTLSGPLQDAINRGDIILCTIGAPC